MSYEFDLKFEDFTPDDDTKTCVNGIAEKLQSSAPSDADLTMAVRRSAGKILATCRIVSQAGIFVAEAIADQPIRAVLEVEDKIRLQLRHWKSRRFAIGRFGPAAT